MNIKTGGIKKSGLPRSIRPGNVVARIAGLEVKKIEPKPGAEDKEAYRVTLKLETHPIEDPEFQGFLKDSKDESKGRYKGQFGLVSAQNWPFETKEGKSKKTGKDYKIDVTDQILQFFQELVEAAGFPDLLTKTYADIEFKSWNELIKKILMDTKLHTMYFNWCIAATQSTNDKGYPDFRLYLPDAYRCTFKRFVKEGSQDEVEQFDKAKHLYIRQPEGASQTSAEFESAEELVDDASFGGDVGSDMSDTELFEGADDYDFEISDEGDPF